MYRLEIVLVLKTTVNFDRLFASVNDESEKFFRNSNSVRDSTRKVSRALYVGILTWKIKYKKNWSNTRPTLLLIKVLHARRQICIKAIGASVRAQLGERKRCSRLGYIESAAARHQRIAKRGILFATLINAR